MSRAFADAPAHPAPAIRGRDVQPAYRIGSNNSELRVSPPRLYVSAWRPLVAVSWCETLEPI